MSENTGGAVGTGEAPAFRYKAFLSYASVDKAVASRIQGFLESYRVPKDLVGTRGAFGPVPERVGRIFRDRTDNAASPDLRRELRSALAASETLIVVCSEATTGKETWVDREIEDFRLLRPNGRILPFVAGGKPPACFPPLLLRSVGMEGDEVPLAEPLAADLRPDADGADANLKLAAALLGVEFDQLRRREERARRRRRRIYATLVAAYLITVTVGGALVVLANIDLSRSRSLAIAERARLANDAGRHDLAALLAIAALPPLEGAVLSTVPEAAAQLRRAWGENRLSSVIGVHGGTIWRMARHPSKDWVLTGGADGRVVITDWRTGLKVAELPRHPNTVLGLAFSKDGKKVAAASSGLIMIWDLDRAQMMQKISRPGLDVRSLDFAPNGQSVVAGAFDGYAYVFDVDTDWMIAKSPPHDSGVMSAAFSQDGLRVLSGSFGGRLLEWSTINGTQLMDHGKVGTVAQVGVEPVGGRWFTTYVLSDKLHLWDSAQSMPVAELRLGAQGGNVSFSADGAVMLSAHWDNTARLTAFPTGRHLGVFHHDEWVDGAAFSLRGDTIVTADHRGQLKVWESLVGASAQRIVEQRSGPGDLVLATDGFTLISGAADGDVIAKDLTSGAERLIYHDQECRQRQNYVDCGVHALSLARGGEKLLMVTRDGRAVVIDMKLSGMARPVPGWAGGTVTAASFVGGASEQIALGYKDGRLEIRSGTDVAGVDPPHVLSGRGQIRGISFDPQGARAAVVTDAAQPLVWSPGNGKIEPLDGWNHERATMSVEWSPDGQWVATGGADGRLLVGKPDVPRSVRATEVGGWLWRVQFDASSRYLLVSSSDQGLVVVDPSSMQRITQVKSEEDPPLAVGGAALIGKDNAIYYRMSDGRVLRASFGILPADDLVRKACSRLPKGRDMFTQREMREFELLNDEDLFPCRRVGPLSLEWYRRRVLKLIEDWTPSWLTRDQSAY